MPLTATILRALRYNLEHGLTTVVETCRELDSLADQLDSFRVNNDPQYAVLVTARSGDQYTIGPFSTHADASKVGQKLEFAAHWKIIRHTHDHM